MESAHPSYTRQQQLIEAGFTETKQGDMQELNKFL